MSNKEKVVRVQVTEDFLPAREFLKNLPESFLSEGREISSRRNVLKEFSTPWGNLVVKSFRCPGFPSNLFIGRIRPSKAKASLDSALELMKRGIDVPSPVGYAEVREGPFIRSLFYVNRKEEKKDATSLVRRDGTPDAALILALSSFIATLHDKGVRFGDLNLGCFLVGGKEGEYGFSLVDTDRCGFSRKVGGWRRLYDLRRLTRDQEVHRMIVEGYALSKGWSPEATYRKVRFLKCPFEFRKKVMSGLRSFKSKTGVKKQKDD